MADPDRWWALAGVILATVAAGYDGAGVDLPRRRYRSPGRPVHDCAQVTVHLVRQYTHDGRVTQETTAPVGDRSSHLVALQAASFEVQVVRDVPGGAQPPPVDQLEAAARLIMGDPQRIKDALSAAYVSGELGTWNGLALGAATVMRPSGLLCGVAVQVAIG